MHKETTLRKALATAAEPLRLEHDEIKQKVREVYRVALRAIETLEKRNEELAAYKAPKLFDKNERPDTEARKEKRFYSQAERIRWFLANDPDSKAFHLFLKHNNMTLDEAKKKAKGE